MQQQTKGERLMNSKPMRIFMTLLSIICAVLAVDTAFQMVETGHPALSALFFGLGLLNLNSVRLFLSPSAGGPNVQNK